MNNIFDKIKRYAIRAKTIGKPIKESEDTEQDQKRNLAILALTATAGITILTAFGIYDQSKPRDKYYQLIPQESVIRASAENPNMPFADNFDYIPEMRNTRTNSAIKPSILEQKTNSPVRKTETRTAPAQKTEIKTNYSTPEIKKSKPKNYLNNNTPITPEFVNAVVKAESKGKPDAISYKGAMGIMQVMPETWTEVTQKLYGKPLPYERAFDPQTNQKVGITHLADIHYSLSHLPAYRNLSTIEKQKCIAAGYNGGHNRFKGIAKVHGINQTIPRMPRETRKYVSKIEKYLIAKR